jgi:hypothetical protein
MEWKIREKEIKWKLQTKAYEERIRASFEFLDGNTNMGSKWNRNESQQNPIMSCQPKL